MNMAYNISCRMDQAWGASRAFFQGVEGFDLKVKQAY